MHLYNQTGLVRLFVCFKVVSMFLRSSFRRKSEADKEMPHRHITKRSFHVNPATTCRDRKMLEKKSRLEQGVETVQSQTLELRHYQLSHEIFWEREKL